MKRPTVYVVIPVFNRSEMTLRCLRSLRVQDYDPIHVIVVDDGSTDGVGQRIAGEYPEVIVLRGDGELWWTGAMNLGTEHALLAAGPDDYILALNNDTVVPVEFVRTLLNSAEANPRAMIGSVVVDSNDPDTIIDGGTLIDWKTAKYTWLNRGRSLADATAETLEPVSVDVLTGRGVLAPVALFREVGLYLATLPQYAADYELSRRAARAGFRLLVDYRAVLLSHVEATGLTAASAHGLKGLYMLFFSRRSSSGLLYRYRFARSVVPHIVPGLWFFFMDTLRLIASTMRSRYGGVRA